jgi:hypothetical protein
MSTAVSWLDGISKSTPIGAREDMRERLLQPFDSIECLDIIVNITLNARAGCDDTLDQPHVCLLL